MKSTLKESIYSIVAQYIADFSVLAAIWSLCIAWPFYQVLSAGATFFAAHNAGFKELLLFVFLLSFAFPLVWVFLCTFAGVFSRRMHNILFAIGIAAPLALFQAKAFLYNPWSWLPFWGVWILGALLMGITIGIAIGLSRWRLSWKGSMVGIAVTLLVVGLFVFSPTMVYFFFPKSSKPSINAAINVSTERRPNIIILLFDELNLPEMMDSTDHINEKLFPNFAKLSKESMWFPNAYAVTPQTHLNVPSIFTGLLPSKKNLPPTYENYPNSIRKLLEARGYNIYAREEATNLFSSRVFRKTVFYNDLSIIFLNVMLPPALITSLNIPRVGDRWSGFSEDGDFDHEVDQNFAAKVENFFDSINRNDKFFTFYHVMLPHMPYRFLYNGAYHNLGHFGYNSDEELLPKNRDIVNMIKMQYLQQACYTDLMLGKILEIMRSKGLDEDAAVIVLSDHGVSTREGEARRVYSEDNIPYDLASIPLFMKIPGARNEIQHDFARHVDIMPTLAASFHWPIPWEIDGRVLPEKTGANNGGDLTFFGVNMRGEYHLSKNEFLLGCGDRVKVKKERFSREYRNAGEIYFPDELHISGSRVSDYQQVEPQKTSAIIQGLSNFNNVRLQAKFLPTFLQIDLSAPESVPIAFAMNGRLYYEGEPYRFDKEKSVWKYIAYLPPAGFVEGNNKIELFMPIRKDGKIYLSPIKYEVKTARLMDTGTILYNRCEIKIVQTNIQGFGSDAAKLNNGILTLTGWAVDRKKASGVDEIVLFRRNDAIVFDNSPSIPRPDIAEALQDSVLLYCGFSLVAPNISDDDIPFLRLFAVSGNNASELPLVSPLFGNIIPGSGLAENITLRKAPVFSQDIVYHLDSIKVDGKRFYLAGWAYLKGMDTRTQKVYIQFLDAAGAVRTYHALPFQRPDIVTALKSNAFIRSGFEINALPYELSKDKLHAKIIIENGELYESLPIPLDANNRGLAASEKVNLDEHPVYSKNITFNLDVTDINERFVHLAGWVLVKGQDSRNQKVYVRFFNEDKVFNTYAARSIDRPDVAASFKIPAYARSGFELYAPTNEVKYKNLTAKIIIENAGLYESQVFSITNGNANQEASEEVNLKVHPVYSSGTSYRVDISELREKQIHLSGWAYVKDLDTRNQKVYIQIENEKGMWSTFTARSAARVDVAEAFKNQAYTQSGFEVFLPKRVNKRNSMRAKIVIENGGCFETAAFTINMKGN